MDQQKSLATIPNTEEVALIRRTIAPTLNADEFALFMSVCGITGLSPISKEIYPLKGRDGRLSIITGVDGFRRIAALSGQYAGQVGPYWLGTDGVWKDYWIEDGHPLAAKVGVLAHGDAQPTWGVAHWKDFYKDTPTWRAMGAHMLGVRAETHAFRKRFSRQMGMVQLDEREPENGTTSSVVEPDLPALPAPPPSTPGTWQHIAEHGTDEAVAEPEVEQAASEAVSPSNQGESSQPAVATPEVAPHATSASEPTPRAPQRVEDVPAEIPRPRGRPPAANATLPEDHPLMVQAKALWPTLLAAHITPDRPARTEAALTAWIARYTKELADATPPVQESF